MTAYIVRRILAMIPLLFFVSLVVFGLTHLAPGDPAITMVGGRQTTPEVLEAIRNRYHLNESLPKQYALWLSSQRLARLAMKARSALIDAPS